MGFIKRKIYFSHTAVVLLVFDFKLDFKIKKAISFVLANAA
jgi:hypothetical protein